MNRNRKHMHKLNIPFAKPYFEDKDIEEIKTRIEAILRSGWLITGPNVEEFEKAFAYYLSVEHAVALNSCTAALHSTLLALKIKSGDEVIVPADTFVATANAALYVGAKPIFADSNPETFNVSPSNIQEKITKRTKAIIVVHLAGNPCDMREILQIAEDNRTAVIEDCAHAHGSKYKGINCGTLGTAGCFSFYPTKIITTAEGGVVTTGQKDLADEIRVIRNSGRAAYGPSDMVELGFNFRLSEIHAAIGLTQMSHIKSFVEERRRIAKTYSSELSKIGWLKPQRIQEGNLCSYYAYIVKLTEDAPVTRDEFMQKLMDNGIRTSILYKPIHMQSLYVKLYGSKKDALPVAEELGEKSVALPMYNGMRKEEIKRVIEALQAIQMEV